MVGQDRLSTIESRSRKMLGHLMRNDKFVAVIAEGKKRRSGRLKMAYSEELKNRIRVMERGRIARYEPREVEHPTPTRACLLNKTRATCKDVK